MIVVIQNLAFAGLILFWDSESIKSNQRIESKVRRPSKTETSNEKMNSITQRRRNQSKGTNPKEPIQRDQSICDDPIFDLHGVDAFAFVNDKHTATQSKSKTQ